MLSPSNLRIYHIFHRLDDNKYLHSYRLRHLGACSHTTSFCLYCLLLPLKCTSLYICLIKAYSCWNLFCFPLVWLIPVPWTSFLLSVMPSSMDILHTNYISNYYEHRYIADVADLSIRGNYLISVHPREQARISYYIM